MREVYLPEAQSNEGTASCDIQLLQCRVLLRLVEIRGGSGGVSGESSPRPQGRFLIHVLCCRHGPAGVAVEGEVRLRSLEWPSCHNFPELSFHVVSDHCVQDACPPGGRVGGSC